MRMWGLIFFRLKPPTHRFILVVILRSFIVSLVPVLPNAVNQVVTMQFVLIAFLVPICLLLLW